MRFGAPVESFLSKVDASGDCWLWTGGRDRKGYGRCDSRTYRPEIVLAHRWMWEEFVGPIPPGLQIDHLCKVKACVNPDHLDLVTSRENTRRAGHPKAATCKAGHPWTPDNEYWRPTRTGIPGRQCRTCGIERSRLRRQRLREANQ